MRNPYALSSRFVFSASVICPQSPRSCRLRKFLRCPLCPSSVQGPGCGHTLARAKEWNPRGTTSCHTQHRFSGAQASRRVTAGRSMAGAHHGAPNARMRQTRSTACFPGNKHLHRALARALRHGGKLVRATDRSIHANHAGLLALAGQP